MPRPRLGFSFKIEAAKLERKAYTIERPASMRGRMGQSSQRLPKRAGGSEAMLARARKGMEMETSMRKYFITLALIAAPLSAATHPAHAKDSTDIALALGTVLGSETHSAH